MENEYSFTFTTAAKPLLFERVTLNRNYFNLNNPEAVATIIPNVEPLNATDHDITWASGLGGGVTPASDGTYTVSSASGSNIGNIEPLQQSDTSWGVLRPSSPGTAVIVASAAGGGN